MLEAVEDRLKVHHFGPTDAELAAVMRYLVSLSGDRAKGEYTYIRLKDKDQKYWQKTTAQERSAVVEHIIEQAAEYKTPLSLRMLRDTIKYYVDQREYKYQTDWRDIVVKELTRHDTEYQFSKMPSRKDDRLESERAVLAEILDDAGGMLEYFGTAASSYKHEVIEKWCTATGKNDRQFRRRLAEMPENLQGVYERLPDRRSSNNG